MLRQTLAAASLTLALVGPAAAQSTANSSQQPAATTQPVLTAAQACEVQMHRQASANKVLAANYNAARVHNDCVAANGSTDVAAK